MASRNWRKSSYSSDQGGECVEVAEPTYPATPTVGVRDSKNPAGPTVTIDPTAFTTFLNWTSTAAE
ncbi:DUF397 domain-containing protein [Streptomyces sp. NPDC088794]|uniref:DUF397 domain-containing protein n=1 Tax=Streptomyces sp. NPDC088794 TaxID=3365902 RepID=UPI0038290FA4